MAFGILFRKPISERDCVTTPPPFGSPRADGGALITMINQKESKRRSDENEAAVKQQFKNLNYSVKRLDTKSSKRRRPDFLISTSSGPLLLCEVKTVDSAFYPRDKKKYGVEHVHISTLDPKFRGSFQGIPIDLTKIDRALADAVRQRAALIADRPETADLPLLVAILPDLFLAEYLFAYPCSFAERSDDFREVSGILAIKEDFARNEAFKKLSDKEQERLLRNPELMDRHPSLPPSSTDFVLFRNEAASREVPEDFACQCLPPKAYYGLTP